VAIRKRRQHVFEQLQPRRPPPRTLHGDIGNLGAHQFANSRALLVTRKNFQHERGYADFLSRLFQIHRLVLVAHRRAGDAERAVIQRSDQRIGIDEQLCRAELLRKRTELAAGCNCRQIVEIHPDNVFADFVPMPHDRGLPALDI
jgi:hypothetical protein